MSSPSRRITDVGAGGVPIGALAPLFDAHRATRACWCTAFCSTSRTFATGWVLGRNRGRLEAVVQRSPEPVGVAVWEDEAPVAWAACGPRSRYRVAETGRSALLAGLDPGEDEEVWLVPCFVVRRDRRGRGLTGVLLEAAVDSARRHGARAVEGWPVPGAAPPALAFLGSESTFLAAGFSAVPGPETARVLMRRTL